MLVPLSAAAEAGQGAELVAAAVIPGQLEAEMVFAATGSPVADWLARYQVADGCYLAHELVELATATAARLAGPERRASLLDIMFAAGDHAHAVWFACNGRGPRVVGADSAGPPSTPCSASAREWLTLNPAGRVVKATALPVDNDSSYPQAPARAWPGALTAPHPGGMRQTSTAGDDTPQASHASEASHASQPGVVVRAGSPTALLAVVPHLLGFVPDMSLVVIGTAPPRDRIRVTLRYDLPDPPDADLAADIAAHAAGVLGAQPLPAAVAVGYGPEALVTPVAGAFLDAAHRAGIALHDILRVENGRYWSYRCGNEACCPAAGVPFDGSAHPASAAMDGAGMRVLPGRAAVAARIAPIGGATGESMRQATRRAERHVARLLAKVHRSGRLGAARHMIAAEGLATVGAMIARYRSGGGFTSDDEIARITVALRDLRVRDDAWARMDPAHADAHQRLWIDVTRRAQPGHVAAPAALLAFVAWQCGDGALANVALDRALADDPEYSMALLLRQVISAGAPPALARLPMTPEEVAASYADADDADNADADDAYDDGDEDDHDLDIDDHDLDPDDEG